MSDPSDLLQQAAAIPHRDGKLCLITASRGGRWVIPKGIIDPGFTAEEAALQEAWEEAGLRGTLSPEPVGSYRRQKWGRTCHITVYLMDVTDVADAWPERGVRERAWVSPRTALKRLDNAELRAIVERCFE
jgi:8-oxo-dGTP pyrophosphatase MutT (NUDIX family)